MDGTLSIPEPTFRNAHLLYTNCPAPSLSWPWQTSLLGAIGSQSLSRLSLRIPLSSTHYQSALRMNLSALSRFTATVIP